MTENEAKTVLSNIAAERKKSEPVLSEACDIGAKAISDKNDVLLELRSIFSDIADKESRWLTEKQRNGDVRYECLNCGHVTLKRLERCPECRSKMVNYD